MKKTGSGLALGGAGLAAACAVVCCSLPLLLVAVPGLALIVGWATELMVVGVFAAVILAAVAGAGMVWRRRQGGCTRGAGCAGGCCTGRSSPLVPFS